MPTTYTYAVRDSQGKLVSGTVEAESETAAASRLRGMGLAAVSITEKRAAGLKMEIKVPGLTDRVKLKDLAIMSRQFATMINSGLSLLRALSILAEQTESKPLARVLGGVRTDVETGSALSVAMAKHPKVFPPLMVNMCKAGEVGGFLDDVLLEVAKNYEAEVKLRSKIKSAMTYPTVVFCVAIIAIIIMLSFVVPTFGGIFKSLGGTLPAPTRLLVDISHLMKFLGPALVVGSVGLLFGYQKVKHREKVRRFMDPLKLRIPVFGKLFQKVALARFCRNLGTMVHAGVPILQSLQIVGTASGNVAVEDASHAVMESVRHGESLSKPLAQHKIFPPMVVQMMSVGEDTGALDQMLGKIAQFYDEEVEAMTEALTSLIEPIMIAVIGGIIGSMVIALYLPMFNVYNLVDKGSPG